MAEATNLGNAVLKVSSEVMYLKAQEAETQLGNIRRSFEQMHSLARSSDSYWQGEAGDLHRTTYVSCQNQAEEMFRRLGEHAKDLRLMAAKYESTERANASEMETLLSDVIF